MKQMMRVRMLGGLSIEYEGSPLSLERTITSKSMQLLEILVYFQKTGIPRALLLDMLYKKDKVIDPGNNLRVTSHRLKKLIEASRLPEGDYIRTAGKVYYWDAPVETWVDALEFDRLLELAEASDDREEQMRYLEEACRMYKGELLPCLSDEPWVEEESRKYREKYTKALRKLEAYWKEKKEYARLLEMAGYAASIYPFDEWQAVKMECYIALGQPEAAEKEYEDTVKLLLEERGITPSDAIMEQFEKMSRQMEKEAQDIQEIAQDMQAKNEKDGAYYCSFPSFRDAYCMVKRGLERSGQSAYLMVCTLTDGRGNLMEEGDKLTMLSEELSKAIGACLRKGDLYSKYGAAQFLILLIGTNQENCNLVYKRIVEKFCEGHQSRKRYLDYMVSSAVDIESGAPDLNFGDSPNGWTSAEEFSG